jgi:streptomycin 6-kinase
MAFTQKDVDEAIFKLECAKDKWQLAADGDCFVTKLSVLQPVLCRKQKAMLKVPASDNGWLSTRKGSSVKGLLTCKPVL